MVLYKKMKPKRETFELRVDTVAAGINL